MTTFNVLFIGDIVGKPGRRLCASVLPLLKKELNIGFVIANGENAAHGSGLTKRIASELLSCGIDVITSGDHIYKNDDIYEFLDLSPRLIRPYNYPARARGRGLTVVTDGKDRKIAVINLLGHVFMNVAHNPFSIIDEVIDKAAKETKFIFIDLHAEATSEKIAMGWHLDGRVTAVCGTHTHVQTADNRVLPNGTAYMTDLGMVGPFKSVIGREIEPVLQKFITAMPMKFDVANEDLRLSGALIEVDDTTGKAISIRRIQRTITGSPCASECN
ncbi:MAG: TIGR00282 family metallophosphoesterase [Candidatus Omnitrophica bacterium]|nr:TIGR00282 family metallophosphoesterase [Candidatus Omnitrophota bacterium]